jgi:signal transduction histidine kinase
VIERTRSRALEVGAQVVHACPPDGRTTQADPDQVKQVMLNLLLNALDAVAASPAGQRCVTIATRWEERAGVVTSWIDDTGSGVPPEQLEKVFDLFYTTKPRGVGLGLAVSSKIVQDHGGSLGAVSPVPGSSPARGARFTMKLPLRS